MTEKQYDNEYGEFRNDGKEYVIKKSFKETELAPWSHILTNGRIGTIVTNNGGGNSWYINSRENKLTTWSNDVLSDRASEVIYIEDEEKKWMTQPSNSYIEDNFETIYGFGYAKYNMQNENYIQTNTIFICNSVDEKVSFLKLKNISGENRKIKINYMAEIVMGVDIEYTRKYIVTKYEEDRLKMFNRYNETYKNKETYMKMVANKDVKIAEGKGVKEYKNITCEFELENNEEIEIAFVLGVVKNKYVSNSIEKYKRELEKVICMWNDYTSCIKVETPEKSIDIMLNGWLNYQVLVSRLWGRTSFYQAGGAYGFRDQLQDVLALTYSNPELVKNQILYHSMHQFFEGDVLHWWHPEKDNGIRTRFTDDLLWMPYVLCEYVKVTGDYKILDVKTSYIIGRLLKEDEDEAYINVSKSEEEGSIYEHSKKAIEKALSYGSHGLLNIGSGDWNDGMNNIHGESVWLSFFMCDILNKFIKICEYKEDYSTKERYEKEIKYISENIEKHAWDGKWYKRAFFEDGKSLGSNQNDECKIDSISQSWSVISNVAPKEKQITAIESFEKELVDYENKISKLLTPPFNQTALEPGYIKAYIPGVRENGGQYTHAAIWGVMAETLLGRAEEAMVLYKNTLPIEHSKTKEMADKYKVEPYVIAADIYGVEDLIGRGGWTWYTGSASWCYKVGIENILGLIIESNYLSVKPCIPRDWKEYKIEYKYRGTIYKIAVKNENEKNTGIEKFIFNGKEIEDKKILLEEQGGEKYIEIIM